MILQSLLEESQIELSLKKIDEIENEQELKDYLESLELSELLEIYYIQSCEINIIRELIIASKEDDD